MPSPATRTGQVYENAVNDEADLSDRNLSNTHATRDYSGPLDPYALSDVDRKELGDSTGPLRDDEVVVYPIRDEFAGPMRRRFAEIRHKYGQARSLKYIAGPMKGQDPCGHMANHAVAVPKEAYERIEAERVRQGQEYMRQFRPTGRRDEYEKYEDTFDREPEQLRMRAAQNAEMFADMGIGEGSPTARMSLDEGLAYYERQGYDIKALGDEARRNGRHAEDNMSRWKQILHEEPRSRGKTIVSGFGQNVNPNSALGQVQQRNARAQAGR